MSNLAHVCNVANQMYEQRLVLVQAMIGDYEGLRKAVEGGGDVNAKDGRYRISAINFAACTGDEEAEPPHLTFPTSFDDNV